jgi:hypothetical protein
MPLTLRNRANGVLKRNFSARSHIGHRDWALGLSVGIGLSGLGRLASKTPERAIGLGAEAGAAAIRALSFQGVVSGRGCGSEKQQWTMISARQMGPAA